MSLATEALDVAADLLESHQAAAIPALHEALRVMLYSTALNHSTRGAEPKIIDQTLISLIRLEKLRILTSSSHHHHHSSLPTTRHHIHLTVSPEPPVPAGSGLGQASRPAAAGAPRRTHSASNGQLPQPGQPGGFSFQP